VAPFTLPAAPGPSDPVRAVFQDGRPVFER